MGLILVPIWFQFRWFQFGSDFGDVAGLMWVGFDFVVFCCSFVGFVWFRFW